MSAKKHYKAMEDVEEYHPDPTEKSDDELQEKRPNIRSALDLQRLKVEKLMKNPSKEIIIPDIHKEKDYLQSVPSFVRNVMGSSAGAGSGEFHVYRHLRRKEYARQKYIKAKSIREQLDDEYREKLERNKTTADEKTAKKRAKRQKKKLNKKEGKKTKNQNQALPNEDSSSDNSESNGADHQITYQTKCKNMGEIIDQNKLANLSKEENLQNRIDTKSKTNYTIDGDQDNEKQLNYHKPESFNVQTDFCKEDKINNENTNV